MMTIIFLAANDVDNWPQKCFNIKSYQFDVYINESAIFPEKIDKSQKLNSLLKKIELNLKN